MPSLSKTISGLIGLNRRARPPPEVHLSSDESARQSRRRRRNSYAGRFIQHTTFFFASRGLGDRAARVKDYQVNFEGDIARGQFLTQVAGRMFGLLCRH